MLRIFRVARPPNTAKGLEDELLDRARANIANARRMLADDPAPDTFAGRKTQEPFPSEEDG